MHYPDNRLRRLRRTSFIRDMVQEHRLDRSDLIWPLFIIDGVGQTQDIHSMPGVKRLSVDLVVEAARRAIDLGIRQLPCSQRQKIA